MSGNRILPAKPVSIIKVVGDFCNFRCAYCFYNAKDQSEPHVMSRNLLERFIAGKMSLFEGDLNFIWHGGEPLLAGLEFFEDVIEFQGENRTEKHGEIRNSIQTNGSLINDEWADFFSETGFHVGVSIDGGPKSQDRFRRDASGGSSFSKTMRGIETLKRKNVRFGAIQTVTSSNLKNAETDFRFFVDELKVTHWGTNVFLDFDDHPLAECENVSCDDWSDYLRNCIELWIRENNPHLRIREIDNFIAGIIGKRARSCSFNGSCGRHICIDWDGKVYPCDRFSGREDLCYGDLNEMSLGEILESPVRSA
ncbi:MAG: radical SAM protein, partial [bacterium]